MNLELKMAEGDHLERAIELIRMCGGDPRTIDHAIMLIQGAQHMRKDDPRTEIRVLLFEFQGALNSIEKWGANKKELFQEMKSYTEKFAELGAKDFARCLFVMPTNCDFKKYADLTYLNGLFSRMAQIAFQQYGVALQLPVY